MKIAIIGSAPSSVRKAPFGDPQWKIWACSPGAYPHLARVDAFWEVHRWEPGVVGKAETQKPWFSPEYVQWIKTVPATVWVADPAAKEDIGPKAQMLPWEELSKKYGHYVWTSSVAYMLAMAIEVILGARDARAKAMAEREALMQKSGLSLPQNVVNNQEPEETDVVGLWGVDMAANEELYSGQRAACQFFLQVLVGLKIDFYVPEESDLLTPPPMYGVSEITHRAIKLLERRREIEQRIAQANAQAEAMRNQSIFLQGALDDLSYHQTMWMHEGDTLAFDFRKVFPGIARDEEAQEASRSMASLPPSAVPAPEAGAAATPPNAAAWSKINDPLAGRGGSSGSSSGSG